MTSIWEGLEAKVLQLCSMMLVVKSRLTVTGFGSESSSGHILNRGCPNSCVLESMSERCVLLMKLEPFFSLLTRFHLVSMWKQMSPANYTRPSLWSDELQKQGNIGKILKALCISVSPSPHLQPFHKPIIKLTIGRRWFVPSAVWISVTLATK